MRLAVVMVVTRIIDLPEPKDEAHKQEGIQLITQSVRGDPDSFIHQLPQYTGDLKLTDVEISVAVQEIKMPEVTTDG